MRISAYAFIIYALHVPLITYLIDPVFNLVENVPHYRDHLAHCGVSKPEDITPETFLRWPLLDKRAIQAAPAK